MPGCGKDTYLTETGIDPKLIVSRDKIRFAILNPEDNYFDQDVQLRVRFKSKDEKEHYKILNDSIDECIRKFKEIKKMIK